MTLRRLHPPGLRASPLEVFSLLLLGQGFTEDEFAGAAADALRRIELDLPFAGSEGPGLSFAGAVLADRPASLALGIVRDGRRLVLPAAGDDALRAYLEQLRVPAPNGATLKGSHVWQRHGRPGAAGAMIGILVKEDTPAELYRAMGDGGVQAGVVAVAVAGDHWHMPLVRGLAQILAGLADEYEMPGDEWETAPADAVSHPNVLFVTGSDRRMLVEGVPTRWAIRHWPRQWEKPASSEVLPFLPHDAAGPNPPVPPDDGEPKLVEGGAGYRRNALRSGVDCLMRRIPADVDTPYAVEHPVQDAVGFCRACQRALRAAVRGSVDFDLSTTKRVRLATQRIVYDTVRWRTVREVPLRSLPYTDTLLTEGDGPHWSCDLAVNARQGLLLSTVRLDDRGDPFGHTSDILRSVEFKDLAISLQGVGERIPLEIAAAFANPVDPPRLEIAETTSPDTLYRAGVKLTLSWDVPGSWAVDATMSVVFRAEANDFDPGGAAMACKVFPQLSLSYRRPSAKAAPRHAPLPKVNALHGTISFVANNVIPPKDGEPGPGPGHGHHLTGGDAHDAVAKCACGHAPGEPCTCGAGGGTTMEHPTNGKQAVSFFTDSNTTDLADDNHYWLIPGQHFGRWHSGRKLAGVRTGLIVPGTGARAAHFAVGAPGLPHWSWLFDYTTPQVKGARRFVGAWAGDEAKGRAEREARVVWPLPPQPDPEDPHRMLVRKAPRQGAYDNIHLMADMADDSVGRPIVAAPFCADLCLHLHWRWGMVAVGAATLPYAFRGWGNGKLGEGAHTRLSAPLIPPNQHLELDVETLGESACRVDYVVDAHDPGPREEQVLLEQGLGLAYSYAGLPAYLVAGLGNGLEIPFDYLGLVAAAVSDPKAYDGHLRHLFHLIYERIRWYDPATDGAASQQIPGEPVTGAPDLEAL